MRNARRFAAVLALLVPSAPELHAQEVEVVRTGPPTVEDFETDKNKDGVPDGWYNACDAALAPGGVVPNQKGHCLRFESRNPGAPARLSRGFGIDGRKHEALIIGLWVRVTDLRSGERLGYDPGLIIDFLGEGLRTETRGVVGPFTSALGPKWTRVARRIPVPPGTRDAIMSVGLLGALGSLEIDGLTFDLVPVGGAESTNLVVNGDLELGVPDPLDWAVEKGATRAFPGYRSASALELVESGSKGMAGVAIPIDPIPRLSVSLAVKGHALRGAGGAGARLFFLDRTGAFLPGPDAFADLFRWAGTFGWRRDRALVPVPLGASRAVLQIEKIDGPGSLLIDDVAIEAAPDPAQGEWTPFHVADNTEGWSAVQPSPEIVAGSALDASFLLDAPAGKHGFVTVRDGRLAFADGRRARFYGVALIAPAAFMEPDQADALADRLARSGINLVRLGDLDSAVGPDRSLFDDSRDDTKAFDAIALAKLDHLLAALKKRGIYVALELQSARRYREEDGLKDVGLLPLGGGAAAVFDPKIGELSLASARALLAHVNPETGRAWRDEPALAWVTLAGELSLFDLVDHPLPSSYASEFREQSARAPGLTGRRLWKSLETSHWKEFAEALHKDGLRVPIAGVSHWRREPEFCEAVQALDLVDDRLYWTPPFWSVPDRRTQLFSADGGLAAAASRKRKADKPYVVGQWGLQTAGAWAYPHEAADVLLASAIAAAEDWDSLVRRGLFLHPKVWGSNSAGTGGNEDIFQMPEVVNGIPQVYSLWPHAASLLLRADAPADERKEKAPGRHHPRRGVEGWDPAAGRLLIDTPFTQGFAGQLGRDVAALDGVAIESNDRFAVVVVSSVGSKPIASADRVLVTALARIEPTGFRWVDEWRRDVADPGRPPLLQEPVSARVRWKRGGTVKAFALDNTGKRVKEVALDSGALVIDGTSSTLHWELSAE